MAGSVSTAIISDIGREYLRLQLATDIGPVRMRNLIAYFGSPGAVLGASPAALMRVDGIGPQTAESIRKARNDDFPDREIERAAALKARIICIEDADYPAPLRNIPDPPACLYVRGTLQPADAVALAVVGTRRCSHYGREQALRFGRALGAAGFTVVSGLARGIDGHAHQGALQAGGRTIAVLGAGLGVIYPREHEDLANEVAARGALVTEYATQFAPTAGNFPIRNRIIAGLSLGVLVVEAGKRSGACITARLASDYNREIFAVPGRVDRPEHSAGVNGLIRDGHAKLVTCLEDILDELEEVGAILGSAPAAGDTGEPVEASAASVLADRLTDRERAILDALAGGATDVDGIAELTRLGIPQVTATLTALELKGLATRLPGNIYHRRGAPPG